MGHRLRSYGRGTTACVTCTRQMTMEPWEYNVIVIGEL